MKKWAGILAVCMFACGPADEEATDESSEAISTSKESDLVARFAPHLFLHPSERNMPANVDWYLARVSMRYDHSGCPDHEVLPVGKVTQAALGTETHPDDKSFCRHDEGDIRHTTSSENFFLRIADAETRAGAPRSEWKVYTVWRPQKSGLVDIEYWFFYAYNDGFSIFNHESDWEHAVVTIDPNAERITKVFLSAHKGGTSLPAGSFETDGTHPVAYVAKGTHANYPKPGSYEIPGTHIAKDDAKKGPGWKTEGDLVAVGTRASPKNGQVFTRFWGKWGRIGPLPETSGVTRHFP